VRDCINEGRVSFETFNVIASESALEEGGRRLTSRCRVSSLLD